MSAHRAPARSDVLLVSPEENARLEHAARRRRLAFITVLFIGAGALGIVSWFFRGTHPLGDLWIIGTLLAVIAIASWPS